MNKIKLLKIVNPVLGISFLIQVISIVAIIFKIGPGWLSVLHIINGMVFVIISIVHVVLNWGWIKANFKKTSSPKD